MPSSIRALFRFAGPVSSPNQCAVVAISSAALAPRLAPIVSPSTCQLERPSTPAAVGHRFMMARGGDERPWMTTGDLGDMRVGIGTLFTMLLGLGGTMTESARAASPVPDKPAPLRRFFPAQLQELSAGDPSRRRCPASLLALWSCRPDVAFCFGGWRVPGALARRTPKVA